MKRLKRIGDLLEDDIEHMHQISARIESRTNRMKNKSQQAFVYSQIENGQNSQEVKLKMESSQHDSKRDFKRKDTELDSSLKEKKLKSDRDSSRLETLNLIDTKPYQRDLDPIKFKINT